MEGQPKLVTSKSLGQDELNFILSLFTNVFLDLTHRHPSVAKDLHRDLLTLQSRVSSEGVSFLTKTLPLLGKALDSGLDTSNFCVPTGFRTGKGSALPLFLGGLLKFVFAADGSLAVTDVSCIASLRQLCYLVYKLDLPFSTETEKLTISQFEEIDASLAEQQLPSLEDESLFLRDYLEDLDLQDIVPRHGPGAVSTGEKRDAKWVFTRKYQALHQCYPYYRYFTTGNGTEILDRIEWYRSLQDCEIPVAKVTLVPKDSRGPRLISMEPLEIQWIQQGQMKALVRHIESHRLSSGRVNFSDQTVNRKLALDSSRNQVYATIDLKDASDRVSLSLVRTLFPESVVRLLESSRSHATLLPNGKTVTLNKFAPMGSAVCFPVEALCFWVLALFEVSRCLGFGVSECADLVYVYGDDIIVPTVCVDPVIQRLEDCGLKVNVQKCCTNGNFRESCGMDAYDGIDVTPLKLRTRWSRDPSSASCLESYASYANELASKGYNSSAYFIRTQLQRIHGKLPWLPAGSGAPSIVVDSVSDSVWVSSQTHQVRFNKDIQKYQVRCKTTQTKSATTKLNDWPRLLRNLCSGEGERPDEVVFRGNTQIRWRWVTIRDPRECNSYKIRGDVSLRRFFESHSSSI